MIERVFVRELAHRLKEKNVRIQVLTGPRQVGKTTIVKQVLSKLSIPAFYYSADSPGALSQTWLEEKWQLARLEFAKGSKNVVLVIDEIQKLNNWSESIKKLWDADTFEKNKIKLVLLGSSQMLLHKGLTESLTGRFELIKIPHWRYTELNEAFDLTPQQYIWYGAYPGAAQYIKSEKRWKEYIRESFIQTSINKDIIQLNRIDKPALLSWLFELGSLYSGQILSFTKILGQLQEGGNTSTLAHYLNLMESAGLLSGLPKYAGDAARSKSSMPKFQTHNAALSNSLKNDTFKTNQKNPIQWGRTLESGIGAYLLSYKNEGIETYYWREKNSEIDFVISYEGKHIGLEIKSSAQKASGINLFKKSFPKNKCYVIGQNGIPWEEFIGLSPQMLF
jgi:predicted AAA+ superfamily ATPase